MSVYGVLAAAVKNTQQVLDDVSLQLPVQSQSNEYLNTQISSQAVSNLTATSKKTIKQQPIKPLPSITIPEHLTALFEQLDWHGQDLDALIIASNLAPAQLIGQLMELELVGAITVQGGRYLRI